MTTLKRMQSKDYSIQNQKPKLEYCVEISTDR